MIFDNDSVSVFNVQLIGLSSWSDWNSIARVMIFVFCLDNEIRFEIYFEAGMVLEVDFEK